MQTLEIVEDNVLITIKTNKLLGWLTENKDNSFYVPKTYTVSQLRTYLTYRIFSKSAKTKTSYFLIAYGCILNNNENIENIYEKYKKYIEEPEKGL